jgi:hypothetical protein
MASAASGEDGNVSIADYPEYRTALADSSRGPAPRVRFHDLWTQPDRFRGGRVEVAGRIERRFRQPAVGEFPPLVETWITDWDGNPICLVFPAGTDAPAFGQPVRFAGTFLRLVRYRGGDGDRLAPLVVGPEPPQPAGGEPGNDRGPTLPNAWDWAIGLGLLALVVVVLGAQHLRARPARRPGIGPPPRFLDPNDEPPSVEGPAGRDADVR